MYDTITTALLFVVLVPGVVLTLPPGASPLVAALVHGVVFWAVMTYANMFVPWWAVWVVAVIVIVMKARGGTSTAAVPPPLYGGRGGK